MFRHAARIFRWVYRVIGILIRAPASNHAAPAGASSCSIALRIIYLWAFCEGQSGLMRLKWKIRAMRMKATYAYVGTRQMSETNLPCISRDWPPCCVPRPRITSYWITPDADQFYTGAIFASSGRSVRVDTPEEEHSTLFPAPPTEIMELPCGWIFNLQRAISIIAPSCAPKRIRYIRKSNEHGDYTRRWYIVWRWRRVYIGKHFW